MTTPQLLPLRIPNPFFEGRNEVYVITGDPLTIIDTGIATRIAYDRLIEKLAEVGLRVADIGRVVLTHKHIDHIGNAWRIQQASGAEIMIHQHEVTAVVDTDAEGQRFRDLLNSRLDRWRVAADARPHDGTSQRQGWEIEPAAAVGLNDGQRMELGGHSATGDSLEVIHTPGHTLGSICVRWGDRLFSGDHVLANTSPNIGGGDLRQSGLLKLFFRSLQRMIEIAPRIEMVYPGHGEPFPDLAGRCRALASHHQQRLDHLASLVQRHPDLSIYEIALRMFGPLKDHHVMLGCAEAESHLEYLVDQGRIRHEDHRYRVTE
jgi:hydroxyacylglutathione hydrolase